MDCIYRDVPSLTPQQVINFWNKVDKTPGHGPNGDCWIWTGGKDRRGYGHFNLKLQRRQCQAHRVAYAITYPDKFDPTLNVCHICDFGHGGCVRPDHLWQGTHADNVRDKQNKGRDTNKGETHWTKTNYESQVKGEQVCTAKLTEEQVREIRKFADSGVSHTTLAKEFGMSRAAISLIAERKRWKHVK